MDIDPRLIGRVQDIVRAREQRRPRATAAPRDRGVRLVALDDSTPELWIYEEIDSWWGVSAADVAAALKGHRGDLHVRINSPGGEVFEGFAIYNLLAQLDGTVTVTVEGLAASAASFIAMAGDKVRMCLASQMMIHDPWGFCVGAADDMRDMGSVLDSLAETLAGIYAERAGGEIAAWRDVMRGEQWYTPQEAIDAGLADEIVTPKRKGGDEPEEPDESQLAATRWDLSVFQFRHAGRDAAPKATDSEPGVTHTQPSATKDAAAATSGDDSEASGAERQAAASPDAVDEPEAAPAPGADSEPAPPDPWADAVAALLEPEPSTTDELLMSLQEKGLA
ncbi:MULTISPECIES: head maturation protease, ClpP-related [Amycolatopsis]|uniref:head maturation protease, ClpP-related n=1 Tax=Amycolatopsis TaxID=1813 RepID=UPI0004022C6E|nr:head maturation protease, ClpP-related [Amycolatopsis thermoflava]